MTTIMQDKPLTMLKHWGIPLIASIVMFMTIVFGPFLDAGWSDRLIAGGLIALLMAGALLYGSKLFENIKTSILVTVIVFLALFVRILCFDNISDDFRFFLQPWVNDLRSNGGFMALKTTQSDYNFPYLYFLTLISYVKASELYLIKILSVAFDLLLAFTLAGIVIGHSKKAALAILAAALLWPTFLINSAYWAQCDSIYTTFCMLSFAFILKKKPKTSVLLAGAAFTLKLQAVFFLPAFIIYLIAQRVKLWHAALFPLPYIITSLPVILLGLTPGRIISVYTGQVEMYSDHLMLNAPSLFAFWPMYTPKQPLFSIGLLLAIFFLCQLYIHAFLINKEKLRDSTVLLSAYTAMITLGLPWLLPSMHERYFYVAEAFILLYVALKPKLWFLAPLVLVGSLGGYYAYFTGGWTGWMGWMGNNLWPFALLMLAALVAACISMTRIQQQ